MVHRRCPHEVQRVEEGVFTAAVDFHFDCTCPDRAAWNCDHYICLCPERATMRLVENRKEE